MWISFRDATCAGADEELMEEITAYVREHPMRILNLGLEHSPSFSSLSMDNLLDAVAENNRLERLYLELRGCQSVSKGKLRNLLTCSSNNSKLRKAEIWTDVKLSHGLPSRWSFDGELYKYKR